MPGEDEQVYETVNMGKNLDTVIEMCKIVEELENKGFPEGVAALEGFGLENVYAGYKGKQHYDALMDIYVEALEQRGTLA